MVSLRIHVLKDKTLVDRFYLNVPEFQVGNSALPWGQAHAGCGATAPLSVKIPPHGRPLPLGLAGCRRIYVRMLCHSAQCVTGLLKTCQFNHKPLGEMKGKQYYKL